MKLDSKSIIDMWNRPSGRWELATNKELFDLFIKESPHFRMVIRDHIINSLFAQTDEDLLDTQRARIVLADIYLSQLYINAARALRSMGMDVKELFPDQYMLDISFLLIRKVTFPKTVKQILNVVVRPRQAFR